MELVIRKKDKERTKHDSQASADWKTKRYYYRGDTNDYGTYRRFQVQHMSEIVGWISKQVLYY